MDHLSNDRQGVLLYWTAKYSTASTVLTASSQPDCMLCTGHFFSFAANQVSLRVVCTDSLSAVQCLCGYSPDHRIAAQIMLQVSNLRASSHCLVFCWVPGHCSLRGSEAADVAAKAVAMHGPLIWDGALGTDVCTCLGPAILSLRQAEREYALGNKLRVVIPSLQVWQSSFRAVREDEVTVTRLRIGHGRLTHGRFLRGEPAPVCTRCDAPLTMAYVLVDYPCDAEARRICHLDGVICDVLGDYPCRVFWH